MILIREGIFKPGYFADKLSKTVTFLMPISHPADALPVFPPRARHKTCLREKKKPTRNYVSMRKYVIGIEASQVYWLAFNMHAVRFKSIKKSLAKVDKALKT